MIVIGIMVAWFLTAAGVPAEQLWMLAFFLVLVEWRYNVVADRSI